MLLILTPQTRCAVAGTAFCFAVLIDNELTSADYTCPFLHVEAALPAKRALTGVGAEMISRSYQTDK